MIILLITTFILGYFFITIEHGIKINKAAIAVVTGVLCWTFFILLYPDTVFVSKQLNEHLSDISQIIFFLMGAMTIVELIDAHGGFEVITQKIHTKNKRTLIWIIGIISFLLAAVLDNLTTTIVMIVLVRNLVHDKNDRMIFAGIIVIAANAGGAWSPIGNITTTMLWIGGQVTILNIMQKLIIPSLVCLLIPLFYFNLLMKGNIKHSLKNVPISTKNVSNLEKNIVFFMGIGVLILVPVFKAITSLPPYMGMLIGLGLLWITTELLHKNKEQEHKITVSNALQKIDIPSILFFLGILLAIAALQSSGLLTSLAEWLNKVIGNLKVISIALGLLSAIVDNVPLVAATIGMYSLDMYPQNHYLWELLAYSVGTGGSILIIGSAAGVAAMGMENINFFWYMKKMSIPALLGFLAGAAIYILMV